MVEEYKKEKAVAILNKNEKGGKQLILLNNPISDKKIEKGIADKDNNQVESAERIETRIELRHEQNFSHYFDVVLKDIGISVCAGTVFCTMCTFGWLDGTREVVTKTAFRGVVFEIWVLIQIMRFIIFVCKKYRKRK